MRETLVLQSKCSIVPGVMYDCSKEHVIESAEQSLKRLQTEYLDVLLLHRPDALMEPEEVAEAFDRLKTAGKVRAFGVSNFSPMQIELLQKSLDQKLIVNQIQISAAHCPTINAGMEVNMQTAGAVQRDGGILEYCRIHDIRVQAWSPLQYGMIQGMFLGNPEYQKLNDTLEKIGAGYGVSAAATAVAWILRHPAKMQVISGTMNPLHFDENLEAAKVALTRQEWYEIYLAAGNLLP